MTQKIIIPPIKSQGIKSKLIPWIGEYLPQNFRFWIEPFMGTGAVGFNLARNQAVMADTNPVLIDFYSQLNDGLLQPEDIAEFLKKESQTLLSMGSAHYYQIRDRFNITRNPVDFLFLNRSCFNGMIRFNKQGNFNVPFCHKPERFSKAYITKITNQIYAIKNILKKIKIKFLCQDFITTIKNAGEKDFIYCDPPYIDRYVDYYNGWSEKDEENLFIHLSNTKAKFILSTWHHNYYRTNVYIEKYWDNFYVYTRDHFYHLGGKEENRHAMTEALITNYKIEPVAVRPTFARPCQLRLM